MKYPDITFSRVESVWDRLGGEEGVQRFLDGHAEIVSKVHVIDCDADPSNPFPARWTVVEHRRNGQLRIGPSRMELWLAPDQEGSGEIKSDELQKCLENKHVLNANVLDYLLANPQLIPQTWKERAEDKDSVLDILFWGTIYRSLEAGGLDIRFLYWDNKANAWDFSYCSIYSGSDEMFRSDSPAAILTD